MDETARHYEIHAQSTSSSRPSLVDLLPSSVKEVTIVGPTTCRNAKKLLDQLAHAKAVHFPGLKNVHMVKTEYFCMLPMMVTFEKAGIILDLDHVEPGMEIAFRKGYKTGFEVVQEHHRAYLQRGACIKRAATLQFFPNKNSVPN